MSPRIVPSSLSRSLLTPLDSSLGPLSLLSVTQMSAGSKVGAEKPWLHSHSPHVSHTWSRCLHPGGARVPGAGGIEASCLRQMVKGNRMPGCRTAPGALGTVSNEQGSQVLILMSRSSHMAPKLALSLATWQLSLFLIKLDCNVEYLFF